MVVEEIAQTAWFYFTTYAFKVIAAILIYMAGKWLSEKLSSLFAIVLEKNKVETTLVKFLTNILYYALIVAIIIAALGQLGINTASFLTVVGAAGLAIGLALKDSLGNFAAGVMLVFFRPFKVGDSITAGGASGVVEEISIFNTIMNTSDNQKVIIPNSSIMGNVITNGSTNPTRRIDLTISIGYADDLAKVKATLAELCAADARVLKTPAPLVAVADLTATGLSLVVRPWVLTEDYWAVRFSLTEKIKESFDQIGVRFPTPPAAAAPAEKQA